MLILNLVYQKKKWRDELSCHKEEALVKELAKDKIEV